MVSLCNLIELHPCNSVFNFKQGDLQALFLLVVVILCT